MDVAFMILSYDQGSSKKDPVKSDPFRLHLINFINKNGGRVGFSPVESTIYFYVEAIQNVVDHWSELIRKEYYDTLRPGETFYYTLARVSDDGFGNPDYMSMEDQELSDRFKYVLIPKANKMDGLDIKILREAMGEIKGDQQLG